MKPRREALPRRGLFVLGRAARIEPCHVTPGGVTQQLEGLENAGLVQRTIDPEDRRVVYLSLTPDGEAKLAEFKEIGKQLLHDVFSKLDDEELAIYLQTQRKLFERLEAYQHKHKED